MMRTEESKIDNKGDSKKYKILNNPEKEDLQSSSSSLSLVEETSFQGLNSKSMMNEYIE